MQAKNSHGRPLIAIQRRADRGHGMDAPLAMLRENLLCSERVELYPAQRLVLLDIPHGELRHHCTEKEWDEFCGFLGENHVPVVRPRWWEFWLK